MFFAFALQQYLHERASVLRIIYTVCLVKFPFKKTVSQTSVQIEIYSVIQKDGLNFLRLYFLNYIWHVNYLHNI